MWSIGVIAYILVCQEMPFKFGMDKAVGKQAMNDFLGSMKTFEDYDNRN